MSFTENSSVHREEKRRELSAERKTGAHDEQPQADQEDEIAIPDGGFKAWTTLLGTYVRYLLSLIFGVQASLPG